jgi:N-acetylmuramoyl-L-alanine amidase
MPTTARRAVNLIPVVLFLAFTALLCALAWILGGSPLGRERATPYTPTVGQGSTPPSGGSDIVPHPCVVIDAGHGGEDGGASSAAGLVEKDVNLAVALALRELYEAAGIPVIMTRTEDKLLYDRNVDFKGRKKVLDLAARRIAAEKTAAEWGDCLFVSIHMNSFPQPKYSGMQVWYSTGDPRSAQVAEAIQSASTALMPHNSRQIKAAGSNIYLLDRIQTTAVLVECGFLSNFEEAARLSEPAYQNALAALIFRATAPYLANRGTLPRT